MGQADRAQDRAAHRVRTRVGIDNLALVAHVDIVQDWYAGLPRGKRARGRRLAADAARQGAEGLRARSRTACFV